MFKISSLKIEDISVYFEKKIIIIFLLGLASGFPAVFTFGSVTSVWLRENGLDIKTIGLFALASSPYNLKFIWAPFIDNLRLGWFSKKLGNRRAWILLFLTCLLYTSPSPRDLSTSRMPSSA